LVESVEQTGTTTRMSGDERREQLLHIAVKLFSEKGFSGTTTREIAVHAGISEAMVFRHFANKDELYKAILDHKACDGGMTVFPWESELFTQLMAAKDDYGVFYNLALNALENHKRDFDFVRLLLHSALEGHELAEMFFEQFVSRMYEFIGGYLKLRQEDGAIREIDARIFVRSFLGMLIHHSLSNLLWDPNRRLLDISDESAAHEFATILLNGIKKGNS
jgi:AcrR family transcriptional regulator